METTKEERDQLRNILTAAKTGQAFGNIISWEQIERLLKDSDRLAAIERQMRIMARGLRAAEGLRSGSPGIDDAEAQQWQRWYDEALALSLNIDAPDAGGDT